MLAHIIVDNRTGHAIHAQGCGSLFALALGSSSHPAHVAWSACLQILTIAIGKSSYPETITASYDSCGGPGLPACLPDGRLPLLPAGEYRVVFFQLGHIVSAPAPIPVRVTPRSLHPALLELKLLHYFTTRLIHSGASVKRVQFALGHSSLTITLNTYVGEWPDSDRETRSAAFWRQGNA